ncbi:monalysin family beta-barrel pore-forming toxin [Pseudomonas alkylphenolica]|uniref:Monalysin family beta-barrel pore-forming toxin n=1 Tax=Pseudomonas alkylphenolica TaxID=237609 RepID=A0A443ZXM1_9PSED|nr:monalysin family beta-barrel pore-forming toxin [Pseudomonas alkylphenolica]RWU25718.1 monalysin family beta-barrel pore-forming toxin [Pseudomonas alkylphenolica]
MSYIDKKMVREIGYFPHQKGNYKIENYLFGTSGEEVKPGCWVLGSTVCGDMRIGHQNWMTFSVPVFAYLDHLVTVRVPTKVKHTQELAVTKGYSSSFSTTVETEISLGAGFVTASSASLKLSVSQTEGVHGSTTRTRKMEMEGPGVFNIYQMHIVYAHCATSAGKYADFFKYSKVREIDGREHLFFLTSIASDTIVPVASGNSCAPLGWEEIQQAVLMDGYDVEQNSGRWLLSFSAINKPGARY